MCGRFACAKIPRIMTELFDVPPPEDFTPEMNIAPSMSVCALRRAPDSSRPEFSLMRWGLLPPWTADLKIANRLFNARAETVHEKPSFRDAFRRRRCLIPADGFYEWQKTAAGKTPYYISMPASHMVFAGLWNERTDERGRPLRTCTIITTAANDAIRPLHDRMPVILPATAWPIWMQPGVETRQLQALLMPCPPDQLQLEQTSPPRTHGKEP
ncbi:MAG: SOS response-associated peptidase [Kiritimatiellia bacterium]